MKMYKDYKLDRFQREALQAVRAGDHVLVSAPTGCGKTLIAEYAIEQALERGERIIYTAPIKALSNQKFRDFGAMYGNRVGIMTGDVTINPGAQALIMTTEIFRNTVFEDPSRLADVRYVIHDEVHYLDDPDRGTVWEESIIFAPPGIRFIGLSATVSNLDQLAGWIREIRPGRLRVVKETRRPVPLHLQIWNGERAFDVASLKGSHVPLPGSERGGRRRRRRGRDGAEGEGEGQSALRSRRRRRRRGEPDVVAQMRALIDHMVSVGHLPAIVFVFSRAYVEKYARRCRHLDLLDDEERARLRRLWQSLALEFELDESEPRTASLRDLLLRGIAFHHAGMLPTLKEVVERLFTSGLIKLLFATETFALGVNMPARAVAFETLKKFDGIKRDWMSSRAFLQMAGRAGRRGIDAEGHVYANVDPETERVPEIKAVMLGRAEEVDSRFQLSYATLLKLYSHLGDDIYEACKRSFAYYRHRKRRSSPFRNMVSLVRKRIELLQRCGYLEGQQLTDKGRIAASIYGYEIQLTELLHGGLIEKLEPAELAAVLVAIVHESKRDAWFMPLPRRLLKPLQQETQRLLTPFLTAEGEQRLPPTKPLDWALARAAWAWAEGAEFQELLSYTDAQPGDVVRAFRMAIQLIRQLHKPVNAMVDDPERQRLLRTLLTETHRRLKRDEIDAERQLRQSLHADAGDEVLELLPRERLDDVTIDDEALDRLLRDELHVTAPPAASGADEPAQQRGGNGASAPEQPPHREQAPAAAATAPAARQAAVEQPPEQQPASVPSQEDATVFFDLDAEERGR